MKNEEVKQNSVAAAIASDASGHNYMEFDDILSRLVDRIVHILQAEKCMFMLADETRTVLNAAPPARGFTGDDLRSMSVPVNGGGLSAYVFHTGEGVILDSFQVETDPRSLATGLLRTHGISTSLSVPLLIEQRNDDGDVVQTTTIGVVHVFNKLGGREFSPSDMGLLKQLSRSGASIFNSVRAFREVVTEKQELIQTLDSLYIGLLMVGLDGRIIQINPPARSVLKIDAERPVIGLRYESVVANTTFNGVLAKALSGFDPIEVNGEVIVQAGTEERVYQAHCAPVKDQDQKAFVGLLVLLNDVTEIRGVDRMKTAFISTVSHELRTPLTSIKGFIATLLADTEGFYDLDTQREFYRIIDTECDRLTRLIDDLLNVSRIEQGKAMQLNLSMVDVTAVATKVLSAQRAYANPDKHVLSQEFPDPFPAIEADADKIDQILTNLVSNAIKYSPRGGHVLIAGALSPDREQMIISVCDEGLGIPREHVKKVFERFHRVDNRDNREIGGTGIGLFLVKALTEAHKGTVRVESELGRGSIFSVVLPIRQPKSPAAAG